MINIYFTRRMAHLTWLLFFFSVHMSYQAEARTCTISSQTAARRLQTVRQLIESGSSQIRTQTQVINHLRARTQDLDDAVSAGRYAFATSMAAATVLSGGLTAAFAGSAMSSGVGFSSFLGQAFSGVAAIASAPITAGMAYGTYRSVLLAAHPRDIGNAPSSPSFEDRHSDAQTFVSLILEPKDAPHGSITEEFSQHRYDPVRSFLTSESCLSLPSCNPIPADFSEHRAVLNQAHRDASTRFDSENSNWWPEVVSNREARRLATVETPYHENLMEQMNQS